MFTETIRTGRLILRRLTRDDAAALHDSCSSDEAVVRFLTRGAASGPEETEKLVCSWVDSYETADFFLWAIEFDGQVIGTVNLHGVCRASGRCEIGFSIGSRWWNRGIMTEAAGAVVRHALDRLNFYQIIGWCAVGNAASARVMEKIGMKKANLPSQPVRLSSGEYADRIWYSIQREKEEAE